MNRIAKTMSCLSTERAKSVLLGLVILTAGAVIGSSATVIAVRPPALEASEPEVFAERLVRQLDRELALTPEQRLVLNPILEEHYRAISEVREEARPLILAQLEELDGRIMNALDERQGGIWQGKAERLEERFPGFRRRRGEGRGQGHGQGGGMMLEDRQGPHVPRTPMGRGHRRGRSTEPSEPRAGESDRDALPAVDL